MQVVSQRFTLDWITLSSFRMNLFHLLRRHSASIEQIDKAGLVFTEYLTNLLKHANAEGQPIRFEAKLIDDSLVLSIEDMTPYNPFLNAGVCHSMDGPGTLSLREGGMGIDLIKTLAERYTYARHDKVNRFECAFPIGIQKPSILLIDDSKSMLALLKAYLHDDFDIKTYENPVMGLSEIIRNPPDVIIVDIHMPELTGDKLIERVRQHEKLKDTKILVLTGAVSSEQAKNANVLGIDAMLTKPTSKKELHRVLDMLLSAKVFRFKPAREDEGTQHYSMGELSVHKRGSVNLKDSGDMLFSFSKGNSDFLILVDVMGHGVEASQIREKLAGFFAGVFMSDVTTPEKIMKVLSQTLHSDVLKDESILPCIICKVTCRTVEWLAAGHPPPILIGVDTIETFNESVQPLPGLLLDTRYLTQTTTLAADERLLLVTDGVFENQSRSNNNADAVIRNALACAECRVYRKAFKHLSDDYQLLNCLWRNSLPLLSRETDDASLILIG